MRNLLLTFIILSFYCLNAQTHTKLKVKGITTDGRSINTIVLKNVTVNVYKYNDKIATFQSDAKGKFQFEIEINSYIMLEFVKEGFLSKKILFDTKNPLIDYSKNYIPFNFEIVMMVKDTHYNDLDFPVTMIEYSDKDKEFLYVEQYTNDKATHNDKVKHKGKLKVK